MNIIMNINNNITMNIIINVTMNINNNITMNIIMSSLSTLRGGGGGGGVHPDYFVKLDFEIAVDQQTRARDRTFEGVPDSG